MSLLVPASISYYNYIFCGLIPMTSTVLLGNFTHVIHLSKGVWLESVSYTHLTLPTTPYV